jgi:hypothetical protein
MIVVGSTKSDKVSDKSAYKTLREWRMVELGPSVRTTCRKKRKRLQTKTHVCLQKRSSRMWNHVFGKNIHQFMKETASDVQTIEVTKV